MPRILFVSGFHPSTRARDLAYEFERFGPLVRCDVPAPRNPHANTNPYAFVEFRSTRDAEDAYYDMHGRYFEGSRLSIQWAKNPPSSVWRYDRRPSPPPRRRGDRDRSRSPRRYRDDRDRRDDRRDDRDRDRDRRDDRPRRSRTPVERRRSASPDRLRDTSNKDKARTPPPPPANGDAASPAAGNGGRSGSGEAAAPPPEEQRKEEDRSRDRARTPPYES